MFARIANGLREIFRLQHGSTCKRCHDTRNKTFCHLNFLTMEDIWWLVCISNIKLSIFIKAASCLVRGGIGVFGDIGGEGGGDGDHEGVVC